MNELLTLKSTAKKGKVLYMLENVLEIGVEHQGGYTTLRLDVHDIPPELRRSIEDSDEDTLEQLTAYLEDYYTNAELDSVSLVRSDDFNSAHRWEDIFSCCGVIRSLIVKLKGKMIRAMNSI